MNEEDWGVTSPCINGSGATNNSGYHSVWFEGKRVGAHRAAYAAANNLTLKDIEGKVVQHICDNRRCVNPKHLVLGTQSSNLKDCVDKGRFRYWKKTGEFVGTSKLSDKDVQYILANYIPGTHKSLPCSAKALAKQFGVSDILVRKIKEGYCRAKGTTRELISAV